MRDRTECVVKDLFPFDSNCLQLKRYEYKIRICDLNKAIIIITPEYFYLHIKYNYIYLLILITVV